MLFDGVHEKARCINPRVRKHEGWAVRSYFKAHFCVTASLVIVRGLLKLQDGSVF